MAFCSFFAMLYVAARTMALPILEVEKSGDDDGDNALAIRYLQECQTKYQYLDNKGENHKTSCIVTE